MQPIILNAGCGQSGPEHLPPMFGSWRHIPAREGVPGDILLIEDGDTLPADGRVLQSISLRVADAALTGESTPVSKDPAVIPEEAGIGEEEALGHGPVSMPSPPLRAVPRRRSKGYLEPIRWLRFSLVRSAKPR